MNRVDSTQIETKAVYPQPVGEGKASDLAQLIDRVAKRFREEQESIPCFFGPVRRLETDGRVFFGVKKSDQQQLSGKWAELQRQLLRNMGLDPKQTRCIQVVGDSACYDEIGTQHNRSLLQRQLPENAMLLWGFTGRLREGGRIADVNGLVNELIAQNPERWAAQRSLANVVSYHSKVALGMPGQKGWGCDGSQLVKHFWLVFGDDQTEDRSSCARFGDDVPSSDNLSQAVISLEGGIQSLNQVIRCLSLGQKVVVAANSRGPQHEASWVHTFAGRPLYLDEAKQPYYVDSQDGKSGLLCYTEGYSDKVVSRKQVESIQDYQSPERKYYGDFFSVGGVAQFFQAKAEGCSQEGSQELYQAWWKEYTALHLPSNPKSPDFATKRQLLEEATLEIAQVGYQLIHNVSVELCVR